MTLLIDIILPVFGIVALGYAATFTAVFDEAAARGLSSFVFHFALPVALFRSMATAELAQAPPLAFLGAYYLATGFMFVPALLLASGDGVRRTLLGFGCAYSNTVLLGIPLIVTALGQEAAVPLFLLIAFHSPIFFTLVTVLIELSRGSGAGLRKVPGNLARGLLGNVVLIAVVAGGSWNYAGLPFPPALERTTGFLAAAAFPSALFAMGAALRRYRVMGAVRTALLIVAAKLLLHPAIVAFLVLGPLAVPPLWAKTAILAAALPVGINVYLFATRYEAAEAESATAILLSNIVSVATIGIVLALLGVDGAAPVP